MLQRIERLVLQGVIDHLNVCGSRSVGTVKVDKRYINDVDDCFEGFLVVGRVYVVLVCHDVKLQSSMAIEEVLNLLFILALLAGRWR